MTQLRQQKQVLQQTIEECERRLDGLRTPEEQVRRVPDPRVDVLLEVVELGLREPEGEK